jgi:hypothetical protein
MNLELSAIGTLTGSTTLRLVRVMNVLLRDACLERGSKACLTLLRE